MQQDPVPRDPDPRTDRTMNSRQKDGMLRAIATDCRFTSGYTGRSSLSPRVMEAMATVPREKFVPHQLRQLAYENSPLPIGEGQTISQPFIVALMTDLLRPRENDVMLEIGAGSGYQAAVLSRLVKKLYTIEVVPSLAERADRLLGQLGYDNVEIRQGDGYHGWPEHAPYDGIIVTAAADHVPPPLKQQLKPGGRLVIPVGRPHGAQELLLVTREEDGSFSSRAILPVAFVPFIRSGEEQGRQ